MGLGFFWDDERDLEGNGGNITYVSVLSHGADLHFRGG